MPTRITWEEIKKNFPDEWVLVTDYTFTPTGRINDGVLVAHSPNKEAVFTHPTSSDKAGFWYTGESCFRGFRSHAQHR